MTLVKGADCAYPFDYSTLPAGVRVILGYVGGYGNTPHVWSTTDVDNARATGRIWCAIWVTPQRALTLHDGIDAANGMLHALPQYGYSQSLPVFLDIEHASYVADPEGATMAVHAWQQGMRDGGWPVAVAYLPLEANTGWVAQWDGVEPATLPVGWRGKQFLGNAGGGKYDLSEFDPELFAQYLEVDEMQAADWERLKTMMDAQRVDIEKHLDLKIGGTIDRVVADLGLDQAEGTKLDQIIANQANAAPAVTVDPAAIGLALAELVRFTVTSTVAATPATGAHAATD